jgi:hypothetical protein
MDLQELHLSVSTHLCLFVLDQRWRVGLCRHAVDDRFLSLLRVEVFLLHPHRVAAAGVAANQITFAEHSIFLSTHLYYFLLIVVKLSRLSPRCDDCCWLRGRWCRRCISCSWFFSGSALWIW